MIITLLLILLIMGIGVGLAVWFAIDSDVSFDAGMGIGFAVMGWMMICLYVVIELLKHYTP